MESVWLITVTNGASAGCAPPEYCSIGWVWGAACVPSTANTNTVMNTNMMSKGKIMFQATFLNSQNIFSGKNRIVWGISLWN